jgi:NAD(P)H-dependent flavin oxidoreductase YrpB (nitropropane dioxygenase family)
LRKLIKKTRTLTDKPFGVGLVLAFPHEENLKVILDEKVAVLQTYWGDCTTELVAKAHSAGVKIIPQVSFYATPFLLLVFLLIHMQSMIFIFCLCLSFS